MIHEATRTLVKSPPEVWEQCSDPESLSRHLNGSFGEIRITRLEPESTVAWEGEHGSGTVTIEPSAWGTRVTLVAEVEQPLTAEEMAEPEPSEATTRPEEPSEAPHEPLVNLVGHAAAPDLPRERLMHHLARLWRRRPMPDPVPGEVPAAIVEPSQPEPLPESGAEPEDGSSVLTAALESMGMAHHRPYSRG
jgi:hypothetical protein